MTAAYQPGSSQISDAEFITAFEACTLPGELFPHKEHLRLAWVYLRRVSYAEAEARVRAGIRRFATHHGASGKYHETMTRAWVRLVHHAMRSGPACDSFAEFAAAHPALFEREALAAFYSPDLLMSDVARRGWVPPDRQPLPSPTE